MHPIRFFLFLILSVWIASADAWGDEAIPRPASIEPQVRFWTRIYSEVDSKGGLIHDSVHLDVVYEAIRLPDGLSRRSRERRIERTKKGYGSILRTLAKGKRSGLTAEQQRVLALWPEGVSNTTLRSATKHIRFQLGQAERFRAGIRRAGRWHDHIIAMLRKHSVPLELASLPHVESSFNPAAYSSVGAAGLWQFTRSTGRLFMRVDSVVDERMDPFVASEGAARLLRSNYDTLKSWPLAITAYNHGVGGMMRAVRKLGTKDVGVIIEKYKSRTFGFASRNFYTEFLAALDVDRNSDRFFGPTEPDSPVAYDKVTLDHFYAASAVEHALGVDRATLREHNRSLRPAVWNGAKYLPRGFVLRIPSDGSTRAGAEIASIPDSQRFAKQHRDRLYKVRRGDTLSKIARRYHVKERDLVSLNNLRSRNRIRAGQILTLPDEPGARAPVSVARLDPPADGVYRVRRGDTISTIAGRFGLTESKLVSLNGLRNRNMISVGQRLRVKTREEKPKRSPSVVAAIPAAKTTVTPPTPVAKPEPKTTSPAAPPKASEPSTARVLPTVNEVPDLEETLVGSSPVIPATDPSDYSVTPAGRITVQAAETLGHYAEWLEVPTHRLRQLNGMKFGAPVVIGRQKKLDFSRVPVPAFETRRLEYHRSIQESFFEAFEVIGTDSHLLKKGDTLWYLAEQRYRLPVWLLRHYNPTLDFGALQAGTQMVIPRIGPRTS